MAQRETTTRHHLIIKKLRSTRATFQEIANYLSLESEIQGRNFNTSLRTFQRDMDEIGTVYGIYIKYNRSGKYYHIEDGFEPEVNDRLFEAFDVYNALKVNEHNQQHILLEKRQAQGTQHLLGLLHAIRNRVQVSFAYQKYYHDLVSPRTVDPLVLKEFKYRWYLIARDTYDDHVKVYALDRMADLEILTVKSPKDPNVDIEQMMKHCFGIIIPNDEKPQNIVLSFTPFQGKYIKSLPLHDTQKILVDNDKELRINLYVYPTYDFKMEILSYGDTVKVIEPKQLANELKDTYSKALKRY